MNYKLDNIPLSSLGAIPSRGNQFFALEGMLDLPKRIGTTEYNWGTSIEPFVDAEDIELDGRTLVLHVLVRRINLDAFKSACVACTELSFDYDAFQVVQKDEIKVEEIGVYCKVEIPFWQDKVDIKPITVSQSGVGNYRIDGYDLVKDFGTYIGKSGDIHNTAGRIDVQTTELYTKTKYRGAWNIGLECSMLGNNFSDVYDKMSQLHAVLTGAGSHRLLIRNNAFKVYFRDGLTASVVSDRLVKFILNIRCTNPWIIKYLLTTEDGKHIMTEDGKYIDMKYYG